METNRTAPLPPPAHCEVRSLNAAQGGALLHHEAQEPRQDGGDGPGRVPRVWVEIRDGKTQPEERDPVSGVRTPQDASPTSEAPWTPYLVLHLNLPLGVII